MPFSCYESIGDVARAHHIACAQANFIEPLPMAVPAMLQAEIDFSLKRLGFAKSEFAACENLIFPIIKEVWRAKYLDVLALWSHIPLAYDSDLCGIPDYYFSRSSPLGPAVVVEEPYLLIVEAKRDDFERGWAQCLAGMLAAQRLNKRPEVYTYGITTNGRSWEFAKLQGAHFTQDPRPFSLLDLGQLCGAIDYLLDRCRQQLAAYASAA